MAELEAMEGSVEPVRRRGARGRVPTTAAVSAAAWSSAHAARPPLHVFGALSWPWGPGGGPESGHWNDRGIMAAYYLTGHRRFLDAGEEIAKVTAWRRSSPE